jgi:hypothetical protein
MGIAGGPTDRPDGWRGNNGMPLLLLLLLLLLIAGDDADEPADGPDNAIRGAGLANGDDANVNGDTLPLLLLFVLLFDGNGDIIPLSDEWGDEVGLRRNNRTKQSIPPAAKKVR